MQRLDDIYFRPRGFEPRLYRWLGVEPFKRALVRLARADVESTGRASAYLLSERGVDGLRTFERRTRKNELIHLAALVPAIVGLAVSGMSPIWLTVVLVLVVAANLHPLMLQRYNRARILQVLDRLTTRG